MLPELVEQAKCREFSENPLEAILEILTEERLAVILDLPEAPSIMIRTRHSKGVNVNLSLRNLLGAWLRGTELKRIADVFLEEVEDVEYRIQQLSNLVSSCLETFLPWILGTLISWINEQLVDETLRLNPELPSYIRWGVPNKQAITLLNQGIRSRRLASQVVEVWNQEIELRPLKLWLGDMTLDVVRERFNPSEAELRNLLQAARPSRQSYAAHVLNGIKVNLQMLSRGQILRDQSATLTYLYEGGRINSIGVVVNHEAVAEAKARDYLDLAAILDTTHKLWVVISSTALVANVSISLRR